MVMQQFAEEIQVVAEAPVVDTSQVDTGQVFDEEFLQKLDLRYAILDEAQHIKNPVSATARAAKAMVSERRLALTGTPTLGDVGSFTNIRISVSDGQASASLPGFRIDVSQVSLGSATLSWTAPTQNEDGSALTNLAGYKIYYGRSSGTYSNEVRIDNPGVTSFVVENLSPDTYFFAATALNSAGAESRFSGEAVKTVN